MGDFTVQALPLGSSGAISCTSPESVGDLFDFDSNVGFAGAAWPVANKALFIPFYIHRPVTVRQVAWQNGTTVSGNVDVGVYDTSGSLLASLGSTAQTGTSSPQIGNIADTALTPGGYFMAMAVDNTTGLFFRCSSIPAQLMQAAGIQEATTSFPLPSTATFANPAAAYVPQVVLLLAATA